MYRKDKPLALKSSASLICNNLTVLNNADRGFINFAVIHKYLINMVCTSTDGSQVTHKQVVFKEPSATQQGTSMIMQVTEKIFPKHMSGNNYKNYVDFFITMFKVFVTIVYYVVFCLQSFKLKPDGLVV